MAELGATFCPRCGAEVKKRALVCIKCGEKLRQENTSNDEDKVLTYQGFVRRKEAERQTFFKPRRASSSTVTSSSTTTNKAAANPNVTINVGEVNMCKGTLKRRRGSKISVTVPVNADAK